MKILKFLGIQPNDNSDWIITDKKTRLRIHPLHWHSLKYHHKWPYTGYMFHLHNQKYHQDTRNILFHHYHHHNRHRHRNATDPGYISYRKNIRHQDNHLLINLLKLSVVPDPSSAEPCTFGDESTVSFIFSVGTVLDTITVGFHGKTGAIAKNRIFTFVSTMIFILTKKTIIIPIA